MNLLELPDLLKLLRASKVFTEAQKAKIEAKIESLSEIKRADLQNVLEHERKAHQEYQKKLTEVRKRAEKKKLRTIFAFAEEKTKVEEAKELLELDHELANINP